MTIPVSVAKRFLWLAVAGAMAAAPAQAAQSRIQQSIDNSRTTVLRGNVHPLARPEYDQGAADPAMVLPRIVLNFQPTAAQQADLASLLQQQQDPASPNFHQWLTPEQYADRFGVGAADMAQVVSWLQSQGFQVVEQARSRTYVAFRGTASQAAAALHTQIHLYQLNGRTHYANASEPSVPAALAPMVQAIHGLNDFRPRPRAALRRARPEFTSSISGNHFLAPDDFATIYDIKALYTQGINGSGQKIAIMGQTAIITSDITTFRSLSGLPATTPTVVQVPGATTKINYNELSEADLDLEWSGAVAPNASLIYVYTDQGGGAMDALQYAISNKTAPIISISYGDCEPHWSSSELNSLQSLAQQANSQGITILAPTGDSGATDCDYPAQNSTTPVTSSTYGLAVDAPGSVPYITAVGGTEFTGSNWSSTNNANNGSALSYMTEAVWNDNQVEISAGGSLAAGGGGASGAKTTDGAVFAFPKPPWQNGVTPADGVRDLPDISLTASFDTDGYLICSTPDPSKPNNGSCVNNTYRDTQQNLDVVGGTSVGPPTFAGILALINQLMGTQGQGNINPRLYALAASPGDAFHDIITGNNMSPCQPGSTLTNGSTCPNSGQIGYTAGAGYDQATGLGSVDVSKLATEWGPYFSLSSSVPSVTVTRGSSATATVTVAAANGFSGTVNLTCAVGSALPGVTCAVSPASINSNGTATLTVTSSATASLGPSAPLRGWFGAISGASLLACGLIFAGGTRKQVPHLCRPGQMWVSRMLFRMTLITGFLLLGLALMPGCGGGGPATRNNSSSSAAASGAITVQAASGPVTHSVSMPVTLN